MSTQFLQTEGTTLPKSAESITPPSNHPVDAEVDIEILKVVPKKFEVIDQSSANWLIRKVVQARQYEEAVKNWAEQERRRAQREEVVLLYLFGRQLENWCRDQIAQNGRKKSVALPAGTIGFRRVSVALQIDDEQAVLAWAKRNCPQAVITVEKLSRSILSDHFKSSGEIPDVGAHIEPEKESFSIR